jgi:hypothetical protein
MRCSQAPTHSHPHFFWVHMWPLAAIGEGIDHIPHGSVPKYHRCAAIHRRPYGGHGGYGRLPQASGRGGRGPRRAAAAAALRSGAPCPRAPARALFHKKKVSYDGNHRNHGNQCRCITATPHPCLIPMRRITSAVPLWGWDWTPLGDCTQYEPKPKWPCK